MFTEENKALFRRMIDARNKTRDEKLDEFFAADAVLHNPMPPPSEIRGLEDIKQWHVSFVRAFPENQVIIEDQIAEGDQVVTRCTFRGVHSGELASMAPTMREITFQYIVISRIAHGKIAEVWENFDTYGFMQQLGAVPPLGEGNNE